VHALGDPADLADPAEVLRRAGLIASQTFGLALGRYPLELPGLADQPTSQLIADIAPTIRRYLNLPLPTPKPKDAPSTGRSC